MGRFSQAGLGAVDLFRIAEQTTEADSHRYRHGWIPTSPLAVLPPDAVDDEYGPELDSVDVGEGARLVAREHGLTVESDLGDDVAVLSAPSTELANRWADAIDDRESYSRPGFSTEARDGGVAVRFGDHEVDLDPDEAADLAQGLRDMAYRVEDHANLPDEPFMVEPDGDETPIPG